MTTKQKASELLKLAKLVAQFEGNTAPKAEDKSRYTYAACAEYRRIHGKQPTQTVIDVVRFNDWY